MWIPRARTAARRLTPLALEAYRRWQSLSPQEKERYRQRAREYAQRGRDYAERGRRAIESRRGRRR